MIFLLQLKVLSLESPAATIRLTAISHQPSAKNLKGDF